MVTRHQPSGRTQLSWLTHHDENIVGSQAEVGTRRRDLVRAASDRENQCAGLGAQPGGRERLSDERRVRGEPQALHRHLRDAGHIAQAQASGSVAAAQRFIVGRADLIHQALDVGAGDVVVCEHAGEDLDRGLELPGITTSAPSRPSSGISVT